MTPQIEVRNVTLNYGDVVALRDMSFALEENRIYGLLGRNGSGKSTLLSVMAAFRKATAGEVLLNGEPVFENAAAMEQICLIRESGDTVDGSEKVELALEYAAELRPWWDKEFAKRLLERFGLSVKKKVGQLSRGQRAALACTLGLASRAPVTMFDESYLGLDAPSRYVFYDELLADFMANPRTVIVSTHLIEEVSSLFEEVVIIDEGRLVLHEPTEALLSRGLEVTGRQDDVDRFADGLEVHGRKQLGGTKSVVVYGDIGDERRRRALAAGLELNPVKLQDLFIHLTGRAEEKA